MHFSARVYTWVHPNPCFLSSSGSLWHNFKAEPFLKMIKSLNACFHLNKHLDTSETIFYEVIRVSLACFQGRAVLLKPLNAYFCLNKRLDTLENVCCEVIRVSLTHFKHRAAFLGQNFEIFKCFFPLE